LLIRIICIICIVIYQQLFVMTESSISANSLTGTDAEYKISKYTWGKLALTIYNIIVS